MGEKRLIWWPKRDSADDGINNIVVAAPAGFFDNVNQ